MGTSSSSADVGSDVTCPSAASAARDSLAGDGSGDLYQPKQKDEYSVQRCYNVHLCSNSGIWNLFFSSHFLLYCDLVVTSQMYETSRPW